MFQDGKTALGLERFGVASHDIVAESFDGDIVVLDLASGKYFGFSDTGCLAWQALAAGVPISDLRFVTDRFGTALDDFLAHLLAHGLLARREGEAASELDDRLRAQLTDTKEAPELFVFDDLADLFKADPIHDVEEQAGWPIKKSE